MKVLVDSCVWSLFLRRKSYANLNADQQRLLKVLLDLIAQGSIAMIGLIRQEILSGIKETAQFENLKDKLEVFIDEEVSTRRYEEAARLYNLCRSRGVECGTVDILICSVALKREWTVLTTDGGLKRCIQALGAEGPREFAVP